MNQNQVDDAIKLAQKLSTDNYTIGFPKNISRIPNEELLLLVDTILELNKRLKSQQKEIIAYKTSIERLHLEKFI